MSAYGDAAVNAASVCQTQRVVDPVAAWEKAVQIHLRTQSGQKKGCPKSTFLGLCEGGLVKGVPVGNYTRSKDNKAYAIQAVRLLAKQPSLADDPRALWTAVMAGVSKEPNSQMDVVIALSRAGLILEKVG